LLEQCCDPLLAPTFTSGNTLKIPMDQDYQPNAIETFLVPNLGAKQLLRSQRLRGESYTYCAAARRRDRVCLHIMGPWLFNQFDHGCPDSPFRRMQGRIHMAAGYSDHRRPCATQMVVRAATGGSGCESVMSTGPRQVFPRQGSGNGRKSPACTSPVRFVSAWQARRSGVRELLHHG